MKPTFLILSILSSLTVMHSFTLAGEVINFPGAGLTDDGDLKPTDRSDNTVTVTGGIVRFVYGGYTSSSGSTNTSVTNNKVVVSGGTIKATYGGWSFNGDSTNNTLELSNVEVTTSVLGGYSAYGNVTGNHVTISGGKFPSVIGGQSMDGNVSDNHVTISAGEMEYVYGGFRTNTNDAGYANHNTVTISGGTFAGDVYDTSVSGGFTMDNNADGNTVTISGGTFAGSIYGGLTVYGDAKNNTVVISGGTFGGDINGGNSNSGVTTGNTVKLIGTQADLTKSEIWGSYSDDAAKTAGNRLILDDFQGSVQQIVNFEYIDITTSGREADMLVITGGNATDLSNVKVNIRFTGMARSMAVGESINIIRNDAGIITDDMTLVNAGQQQVNGATYVWDFEFGIDGMGIFATVTAKEANAKSRALPEGRLANIAYLNSAADLVAEQGVDQSLRAKSEGKSGKSLNLFAAMSGTASSYETGSDIDLNGYAALAGASLNIPSLHSLTCGLFAESGWGHYRASSYFDDGTVRGSGHTEYYGGGMLTHYDFSELGIKGLSVEGSFRSGRSEMSYVTGDLANANYKLNVPYYGMHVGINYTRSLTNKLSFLAYSRFLWSHLDGDSTQVDGSDVRFETMNSQRIQTGSRFFYEVTSRLIPYAGLSYQWECSGCARAKVDDAYTTGAPSMRGGTGTGELGAIYQITETRPMFVEANIQGHVGERQGMSGMIKFRVEF